MKKGFGRKAFLSILAVILFSSCSSTYGIKNLKDEDLLIKDNFNFEPKAELTSSEIKSDLNVLVYALKNAYGGRKYVPQDSFISAISGLEKINLDKASSQNFCEEIEKNLIQIPDMHLSARIKGNFCSKVREEKYILGRVGQNYIKNKNNTWEVNEILIKNKKIPLLSIASFPKHEDSSWNGFLDEVFKIKKTAPAIIIDLRGNGGGDDSMGLNMAAYLFGQDPPSSVQEIIKSQTPATFAIAANNPKSRILRLKLKNEPVPEYWGQRLKKDFEEFEAAKVNKQQPDEVSVPGEQGKPFDAKKAYTKPIIVLIDKECASSCESTLEVLMLHPKTITIGENTGGYLHFGNIGLVVLPNSQIFIQLATDFWKYKDGRYLEGIGYSPKIKVNSGSDALESAKKYLSKLL